MAGPKLLLRIFPPPTPKYQVIDGLAIENAALELGDIWEQPESFHELTIHNQSETTAEISDLLPSCGCLSVQPRTMKIPPHGSAAIRLQLDLTAKTNSQRQTPSRSFAVTIWPRRKGMPDRKEGWNLSATINSRITLDVLSLEFGDEPIRGQPPLSRTVIARVHVPNARLQAKAVPEIVTVAVCPRGGMEGEYALRIAPKPTLAVGMFRGKVCLDLRAENGERLPGIVLPISGEMRPEVRPLPASLVFGPLRIGQTAEATVTLQAPAGENLVVDHIETESEDVQVKRLAKSSVPDSQLFRLQQRIRKPGHQASKVRFFVRKGSAEPEPLTMEVNYDGDEKGILSGPAAKGGER